MPSVTFRFVVPQEPIRGSQSVPSAALTQAQYETLLHAPDLRTTLGLRDRAKLRLGGDAGLRRSEIVALTLDDVIEARRVRGHREAIAARPGDTTSYVVLIANAKHTRGPSMPPVPLSRAAWDDLAAWMARRPNPLHDQTGAERRVAAAQSNGATSRAARRRTWAASRTEMSSVAVVAARSGARLACSRLFGKDAATSRAGLPR